MKFDLQKWLLPITIIIALLFFQIRSCNKLKEQEKENSNLVNAFNDSISHYVNKHNDDVATISVLQTSTANAFLAVKSKDEEIKELQAVVKDYKKKLKVAGSSVTNITGSTAISNTGTTTVTPKDTVRVDSLVYIYPEYTDSLVNAWVEYKMKMNKDSSKLDIHFVNKYSAIIGYDKRKPFVDVINYSPYSKVEKLRTYQVRQPPPKRFGVGISAGVTYDFIHSKAIPYIGAGINYNLIRF